MNFCKLFIAKPVATIIIMIALTFAGVVAYFHLPISELPNVDFPTIEVAADLPGADPETMATSVATPLEKALSTVSDIDSMSSVSSAGSTKITIQFGLDRNIDAAAQDVQSALLGVSRKLPSQMPNPPSIKKVNPADAPVLFLALTADRLPMTQLDDYAENDIVPNLSMAEGVSAVNLFGAKQYAVRIHVNPNAIQARGLSLTDVATAVKNLNANQPTGILQTAGFYHLIKVDGGLHNADEFGNAIVSVAHGAPVRLKDIAVVQDSVANDKAATWYNNQPAIVLAIQRQPGSNTVAVVNNVLQLLPSLTKDLPGGVKLRVVYNRAVFIHSAIQDVQLTLIFAIFLVTALVFWFLRSASLTCIAAISLPISVIATFAVMYLLGYSLDNLSLMALVLAVGFVIDDAIVVLENIVRHVENGMDRLTASLRGTQEVSFTVVAMTLSLVAVFIPIFFMGGIIGRLFHEFAAVVGIAILLSGFVALSLIPMLCSRCMKISSIHTASSSGFLAEIKQDYEKSLRWALDHRQKMLWIAGAIVLATIILFYIVPKGFIPSEDAGMIFGSVEAPEGITYQNFVNEQHRAQLIIQQNKNVEDVITAIGESSDATASTNTGRFVIKLKPMDQRRVSADKIIGELNQSLSQMAGLKIILMNPPAIRIGGKVANSNYQYVLQGMNWQALEVAAKTMKDQLSQIPGVVDVDSDLQMNNPELSIHLLRDKAAALGITPQQIEAGLYAAYGQEQVTSIMNAEGDYSVIMDIDPQYQHNVDSLQSLYLKSSNGSMVPLGAVAQITQTASPLSINHYGQLPAITLSFDVLPGFSLGSVTNNIQHVAARYLPADVTGSFAGSAQKFQQSMGSLPLLLLFTVLVIYMVLAILYENFIHPLTILTALPFAIFGALLCLYLFNQELDIFSFIGIVMLVGLTKKNGIMMVDFALEAQRSQNISAKEAIVQACMIRFRPIMMTTFSAILATLPIALGLGAGGETRRALGVAVVGGILFSQFITLYITPVFYLLMDRLSVRSR